MEGHGPEFQTQWQLYLLWGRDGVHLGLRQWNKCLLVRPLAGAAVGAGLKDHHALSYVVDAIPQIENTTDENIS